MSSSLTRHLIYTVTMAASLLTAGASPAGASPAGAASPAAPGTNWHCEPLSVISPAPIPRIPSPADSPRQALPPQPPRTGHPDACVFPR